LNFIALLILSPRTNVEVIESRNRNNAAVHKQSKVI